MIVTVLILNFLNLFGLNYLFSTHYHYSLSQSLKTQVIVPIAFKMNKEAMISADENLYNVLAFIYRCRNGIT